MDIWHHIYVVHNSDKLLYVFHAFRQEVNSFVKIKNERYYFSKSMLTAGCHVGWIRFQDT